MKPFKPPSFKAPAFVGSKPRELAASEPREPASEPPAKRRRISERDDVDGRDLSFDVTRSATNGTLLVKTALPPSSGAAKKFVAPAPRKPLDPVRNPSSSGGSEAEKVTQSYYNVLWRKFTTKKNKTWDGDGVLSVKGTYATLQDISGKELGRGVCKGPLLIGSELSIGGKEIEVDTMISREDYLAGRPFLGSKKVEKAPLLKDIDGTKKVTNKAQARQEKIAAHQKDPTTKVQALSKTSNNAFKTPVINSNVQHQERNAKEAVPRHKVDGENALVMKRPKSVPKGRQMVDVVVDPILTRALREHQRVGVSFLYECVMGMKDFDGEGAILADEMGLGKTLQTIALLWTLLKQDPAQNPAQPGIGLIKKALIVCPVTVIKNWKKEIYKWLGKTGISVFVADNHNRITDFTKGKCYNIMIIGYEKLVKVQKQLQEAKIDIVIADEGHRLKTAANKAAQAIKSLNTDKRIILSGTPIQNDLSEFFMMVDLVNPSVLGKYTTFKREFEGPIVASRQPGATAAALEKGEARSEELANITNMFILRRTSEILSKYLPPKTEYVVFCKPTKVQKQIYRAVIEAPVFVAAMNTPTEVLRLITMLKKVCNAPKLLIKKDEKGNEERVADLIEHIPQSLLKAPHASGKLAVLDDLLFQIDTKTDEKVVLVSNYTSTLDVLQDFIGLLGYSWLRLDGSTPVAKRQDLVDTFNRSPKTKSFVFLLSAKAGGVGINLIGASRLILYDLDWNPATDLQAMARVHRDGQKRPCHIYRLLTQGALDEKIFQRQISKTGLAESIVDGKSAASGFSQAELRDLFKLDESDDCQTHKLLGCSCGGNGLPVVGDDTETSSERNDLASLSDRPEIEVVHLEDSDEVPAATTRRWQTLGSVDVDAREAEIERKGKESRDSAGNAKMLSLMRYTHFDTALIGGGAGKVDEEEGDISELDVVDVAIEDKALQEVLKKEGRRVGFVLVKRGHENDVAEDKEVEVV
ncbi:SNF2 family DNA-dependent ATPase domain-containing protein [Zymoseptoria tritici IPO323]|uniref:SNF2 family DNA-dependent ATPase domain-containing protein n=1 Tax=Zymoseptoria tritici (strain CBS 115943 / IPO323) TaxID=336722 RepID=F9X4X9_ZYMTI|nr:SNF2 family DNA-dependent ATPase domain-containing protein [Zymoseptoria tritici IPO323]EGP90217.1 SNF2 family DNA-dependent ATPase domain-containing protein [Zymoseptoria tritici IPO323]